MSREELIKFIKANDENYNYDKVDFKYYTDEELEMIYKRIKRQMENNEEKNKK